MDSRAGTEPVVCAAGRGVRGRPDRHAGAVRVRHGVVRGAVFVKAALGLLSVPWLVVRLGWLWLHMRWLERRLAREIQRVGE